MLKFYLDIDVLLCVVKEYDVDVIYLGYGFLSENVYFVCCCWEEGVVFIGLDLEVMDCLGDKVFVKKLVR